jgi:purine nucleosidase
MKFIKLLIISTLFVLVSADLTAQYSKKIILDADTDNEVDDLFAISRALLEPSWNILALNAAQWQTSHWTSPQAMENSYRLNQNLVEIIGRKVPQKRGGVARMFDWGDKAQHSAAAYEIIKQAKLMPENEKLTVVSLGALTNVASAIFIDPSIENKINLYWLGSAYDFEKEIFDVTEFNCVMDIQAMFIMLKSKVEMHIIPVSTAKKLVFNFAETEKKLKNKHQLGDVLTDRWFNHQGGGKIDRIIWDLALIEAMIHPELATEISITTSKDMGNRKINFYNSIDAEKMKTEFFEVMQKFFEKK